MSDVYIGAAVGWVAACLAAKAVNSILSAIVARRCVVPDDPQEPAAAGSL